MGGENTVNAAKNFEDLPLILKADQVADVLGVSVRVVYNLTKRQDFPAIRVGEKRIVIPRDHFLRWLHNNAKRPID